MEDALTTDFWDILLWSFWFFIWIAAFTVWFRCLFDLFGDKSLSGWAKAGWACLMIFVPWIGALIYLIARGKSMTDRQMTAFSPSSRLLRTPTSRRSRADRPLRRRRSRTPRRSSTPAPSARPSSTR